MNSNTRNAPIQHQVVIIGAGAAGIATASSLLARAPGLDIALIDPADTHYYQPGWTLVGAGVFSAESTARPLASLIPRGAQWIRAEVSAFEPDTRLRGAGRPAPHQLPAIDRLPWPEAELECHRRPGGDPWT